jgi:type I restriction enzyme S subunit
MTKVKLGDVAIERKQTYKGDKGDTPSIGLEHLIPGEVRLSKWDMNVDNTFTKGFTRGQILLGRRRAYLKKAVIAPFDGICSGDITTIEAIPNKIREDLLPFIIQNDRFFDYATKGSAGSLSPRVKWEYLKDYEFDLPPIEEQERLAKLLWAAYELKESYKKLIVATDEMVKAQFMEVLKLSHSHISFTELFEYINRGKSPQYVDNSNVLVINQACIYWGKIRWENVKYQDLNRLTNKRVLENGDILLNSTGTGTLGRCVVYNKPLDKNTYIADGHVTTIKVNQSIILPDIFCMYLSLTDTQKEIYINCVRGSTNQIELSKEKLLLLDMPLIPIDEQEKLLSIKQQADKSKAELQQSIENIDKVMKSLLP